MWENNSYKHSNLLDVLSRINNIVRSKKPIDETLMEIADSLHLQSSIISSSGICINYNNTQYISRNFTKKKICSTSHFTTKSDSRCKVDISSFKDKSKLSEEESDESQYLLDNIVGILNKYLSDFEDTKSKVKGNKLKANKKSNGPVNSRFLQKFLNKYTYNRDIYHDLMPFKVKEILLISSLYDAYSIESEGRFSEHMLGQYGQLNLTSFPRITGASSLKQAMELMKTRNFEMVIYMVGVDKITPLTICEHIKKEYPFIPIYLLLNNSSDISVFTDHVAEISFIDNIFTWTGDASIFFSIIKQLEDRINSENDTQLGMVRVILLVEDSPIYYSRYLSFLYKVIMEQTKRIINDVSTDELYKVLRMRARPKILLAKNYEEAVEIIDKYRHFLSCLITDVKFERNGEFDEKAGLRLLKYTQKKLKNLPTVLQSSDSSYSSIAVQNNSLFIHKHSDKLYKDFENFISNYLGFGDFTFKDEKGNVIAVAANMKEFESLIKKIPDNSLLFHASRNHFSMWIIHVEL